MNIFITLDYELFFGKNSGSCEKCIIEPTNALLKIVDLYQIKFTCFVDAGYLVRLNNQKDEFPQLAKDWNRITDQIKYLSANGHGIELHVHPHWEDSFFNGKEWIFDTSRYKLSDFSEEKILDIITRYNSILKEITDIAPVAFRAGGWCAQPFKKIKKALEANNIFIDSTVYPNGLYKSEHQFFDFSRVSQFSTQYRFSEDLTVEDPNGKFTEIPISSIKVNPWFFWRFVIIKIFKKKKHIPYGNGNAISLSKKQIIRLLSKSSYSVVSIDGFKASYILRAFKKYQKNTDKDGNFVLIGHPKSFTPYSLYKVKQFIKTSAKINNYTTYRELFKN
ncbi:polysaccharide deacetylase family protein [Croceitalea rosinachiae]|uniref:Polysaccharide deacetylase family protein n=1 Tax=Croceitalea rosinachiae TaxID=3075596 RepID=A0ABU3A8N1_9FLAO|nr:polysaccharide deacetylase family protein [Croceitalea sp. F388]MDT0606240.1 polysaccharide deacetylase family protein [Croceitalea sp. F388]